MEISQKVIDMTRMLSVGAIEKANSDRPGFPLEAALMAYTCWSGFLHISPKNSNWPNRDRFILSAGHRSALLYSLLHLFGSDPSLEDLKNFRQLRPKTPGHPEHGHTRGMEVTIGPLGSGIFMTVGLALGERYLRAVYNKEDIKLTDHYTYILCGGGDLMEGISNGAASFAGTQKLSKLIALYDSNAIIVEGSTDIAFTEDAAGRYRVPGQSAPRVGDGNGTGITRVVITRAKEEKGLSLIEAKTKVGYDSPKEGSAKAHGEPLGAEDLEETRAFYHMEGQEASSVAPEVYQVQEETIARKNADCGRWLDLCKTYQEKYPEDYAALKKVWSGDLDLDFLEKDDSWKVEGDKATQAPSGMILNRATKEVPRSLEGPADLAPFDKAFIDGEDYMSPTSPQNRNVGFGIREHAMGAIVNGLPVYGGLRAYGIAFLVFSDYLKPQLRLAALMGLPSTFIFTHSSIGVGRDGPTHQPIDQLVVLRVIPNLITFRPADTIKVAAAWIYTLRPTKTLVVLIPSRQTCPKLKGTSQEAMKGGYVLLKEERSLDPILLASGSEVVLSLGVTRELRQEGLGVRVVLMPSWEVFETQSSDYRKGVLSESAEKRASIKAGFTMGQIKFTGFQGTSIGINELGASGPGGEVFNYLKMTKEDILKGIHDHLGR